MGETSANGSGQSGTTRRLFLALAITGLLLFLLLHLSWRSFLHGDEGVHAKLARNVAADASHLLLGSTDPYPWSAPGDRHLLHNTTPFYPGLLAPLTSGSRDPRPLRIPTFLAWLLTAASLAGVTRMLAGDLAGLCAGTAFLLAPGNVEGFGLAIPDPLLTALAWVGLLAALAGSARGSVPLLCAAGVCWGLAFLVKLWLVGEVLLAWLLLLAGRRLAGERKGIAESLAWPAAAFVLTASIHLLAVWLIFPEHAQRILQQVYIGFSAAKFTGTLSAPEHWLQPWYYYLGILVRDHWPALFLTLPGLVALRRRPTGLRTRAVAALLAAFGASLLVLSLAAAKHPLYILPSVPTLYLLAGVGAAFLLSGGVLQISRGESRLVLGGAAALAGAVALLWSLGIQRDEIPLPRALAVLASGALLGTTLRAAGRGDWLRDRWAPIAVAGILVLGAADEARRGLERPAYPYAHVADLVREPVQRARGETAFVGPDINIFEYYLGRRGEYGEAIEAASWPNVRRDFLTGVTPVIIESRGAERRLVGTLYRGSLPEGERRWLKRNARRVLNGPDVAPFRVYIAPPSGRSPPG